MELIFFIEVLAGGLLAGVMYALVALGFVLIYKASGVFNFAQGSMVLFAALTFVSLTERGWNFWLALVATLAVMVLLAVATERVVRRPLVHQAPITLFMAAIGLAFVLEGLSQLLWGSQPHGLELGIPDVPMEWLSRKWNVNISQFDLFAAFVAGALVAVLALLFQKTRVGRALRAVADDHQAALAVGIPLQHIWAIVWAVAGFVALVAGDVRAPLGGPELRRDHRHGRRRVARRRAGVRQRRRLSAAVGERVLSAGSPRPARRDLQLGGTAAPARSRARGRRVGGIPGAPHRRERQRADHHRRRQAHDVSRHGARHGRPGGPAAAPARWPADPAPAPYRSRAVAGRRDGGSRRARRGGPRPRGAGAHGAPSGAGLRKRSGGGAEPRGARPRPREADHSRPAGDLGRSDALGGAGDGAAARGRAHAPAPPLLRDPRPGPPPDQPRRRPPGGACRTG